MSKDFQQLKVGYGPHPQTGHTSIQSKIVKISQKSLKSQNLFNFQFPYQIKNHQQT